MKKLKKKLIPYDIDLSRELKLNNRIAWNRNHKIYLKILKENRLQDRKELNNIRNKIYRMTLSPQKKEKLKAYKRKWYHKTKSQIAKCLIRFSKRGTNVGKSNILLNENR